MPRLTVNVLHFFYSWAQELDKESSSMILILLALVDCLVFQSFLLQRLFHGVKKPRFPIVVVAKRPGKDYPACHFLGLIFGITKIFSFEVSAHTVHYLVSVLSLEVVDVYLGLLFLQDLIIWDEAKVENIIHVPRKAVEVGIHHMVKPLVHPFQGNIFFPPFLLEPFSFFLFFLDNCLYILQIFN